MPQFHVLMLEDDPVDVELIITRLRNSQTQCSFSVVDNRADFEAAMEGQQVDIVLADYSLPSFDGISAIALVHSYDPDIPCILVSGVIGEERAIEALKSGATDYVLKSRLERLEPAFTRALRERQEVLKLNATAAALQASEERFRTSVEVMLDCLSILSAKRSPNGEIEGFVVKYLNTAACDYLSVSASNQIGKPLQEVIPGFESAIRDSLFYAFCFTVDTGNPFQEEIFLNPDNNNLLSKNLSDLDTDRAALIETIESQFVALEMKASKLDDGIVITWRDITAQKQIEQQRLNLLRAAEQARNQAEAANQFKDEFIATLSHELKTPLNAIDGWMQLACKDGAEPNIIPRAFEVVRRNTASIERIISDLSDVTRINEGKLTIDIQPIAIAQFARLAADTLETISPTAAEKEVKLICEFERTPLQSNASPDDLDTSANREYIAGDPARLKQVIWNLVSNAIKFTPQEKTVSVSVERQSDSVVLSVQDTGIGIAPSFLPHVFDRFQQADPNGGKASSSLGLGLSIVHHIVESHGGQIKGKSAGLNQGSLFTVSLPLKTISEIRSIQQLATPLSKPTGNLSQSLQSENLKQPQTSPIARQPHQSPNPSLSLENVRVLVVEDQPDAIALFKFMLESYDATVVTANTVPDALKKFRQFQPDVLVSDIGLPSETGYDLIRKIRSLPTEEGGHTPAIALSAYTETPYRTRALLAGFQMHIPKPVDLEALVSIVAQLAQTAATKE